MRYARIRGSREAKLAALDGISGFDSLSWQACPDGWQSPFLPATGPSEVARQVTSRQPVAGGYHGWPLLTDLMPWQHSGMQLKRTWPIAPDENTLRRRWRGLLTAEDRGIAFRETNDRKIDGTYDSTVAPGDDATPIALLGQDAPVPELQRYAYRSFDRQFVIADSRLTSRPRPSLWRTRSIHQLYLSSLLTKQLAHGPALTVSAFIPDLDHFSGRGAKDTIPLYRTSDNSHPNILPGLLEELARTLDVEVTPEDFVAYLYGMLAQPTFTATFAPHLIARELRVPITKNPALFDRARRIGAHLLWLHTYGERFVPAGKSARQVLPGTARCVKAVPGGPQLYPESFRYDATSQTVQVGAGRFAPVQPEVFEFEVSGLHVVRSWLGYRMKLGGGRKSSPLNEIRPNSWTAAFTTELLELLWVLEATVAMYQEQGALAKEIFAGDCFLDEDLPPVPPQARRPASANIEHLTFGA